MTCAARTRHHTCKQANGGSDSPTIAIGRVLRTATVVRHTRPDWMRSTATWACSYLDLSVANLENMHFATGFSNFPRKGIQHDLQWVVVTNLNVLSDTCPLMYQVYRLVRGKLSVQCRVIWAVRTRHHSFMTSERRLRLPNHCNLTGSENTHHCGRSRARSDEMYSHVGLQQVEPQRRKLTKIALRNTFFEFHTKGFLYD